MQTIQVLALAYRVMLCLYSGGSEIVISLQVLKLHTCLAPYKVAVLPIQEGDQDLCMVC